MPLNTSALPMAVQEKVKGFSDEISKALGAARDKVAGGKADGIMDRWFGGHDQASRIEIRDKLSKLRSYVMHQPIRCRIRLDRPADENALAEHVTGGLVGGGGLSSFDRLQAGAGFFGGAAGVLNLSPNFPNLQTYATAPVSTYAGQDQFETVVHELSHIVLGTADETLNDGSTAYHASNARLLATEDAVKAKNNAENWGFFVEEFRA
jgi:hypothetical protein